MSDPFDPAFTLRVARWIRRASELWFDARVDGMEHLPDGPFLGVGTHNGGVLMPDMWIWLARYHEARRATPIRALAHDMLVRGPGPIARVVARLGAIRADPGEAERALAAGCAVQVYPGGDFDAEKPWSRRNQVCFAGRLGWARLAIRSQVPVVPVVSVGAHETMIVLWDGAPLARLLGLDRSWRLQVFPLLLALPWGVFLGVPPFYLPLPAHIEVRVLAPVAPPPDATSADDPQVVEAFDREVRGAMQAAIDGMARDRLPIVGRRAIVDRLRRRRGVESHR